MPVTKFTPTTIEINGRSLAGLKPLRKTTAAGSFSVAGGRTMATAAYATTYAEPNLFITFVYKCGDHYVASFSDTQAPLPPAPTDISVKVGT